MSIDASFEKLVAMFRGYFQPKGIVRRMTVTNAKPAGKAQIIVGTIGEGLEAVPGQTFDIGNGDVYANGEVYELLGSGDPNDPQWRIGRRLIARNPPRGADRFAALPAPVWSAITNPDDGLSNPICLGTEADMTANVGLTSEPMSLSRALYRVNVPGSYSTYKDHLRVIQVESKRVNETGWRVSDPVQIKPERQIRITLNANITSGTTAVTIALPADVALAELHPGYYVHWKVGSEVMIGKVVTATLLTILAVGGRGAEGSVAASHSIGDAILLLTGQATIKGLEPGTQHQVRLSFVDGYGIPGPPSVVNVLTTWKRVSIPNLTTGTLKVNLERAGYRITWTRPLDPTTGVPMTTRLFYRIWRNTSKSLTGAKMVAETTSYAANIPTSLWDPQNPATALPAGATWFGIQVLDGHGNISAGTNGTDIVDGVTWAQDNVPSPHPSYIAITLVPDVNTMHIHYDEPADTSGLPNDSGWGGELGLLRADNTSGSNAALVKTFFGGATEYKPPLDKAYYYQVVSIDLSGNASTAINSDLYWRVGIPEILAGTALRNGAFQTPDSGTRTVTDAVLNSSQTVVSASSNFTIEDLGRPVTILGAGPAGADFHDIIRNIVSPTSISFNDSTSISGTGKTLLIRDVPHLWRFQSNPRLPLFPAAYAGNYTGIRKVEYVSSGGQRGNRAVRLTVLPSVSFGLDIQAAQIIPYNSLLTTATITFWLKAPAGTTLDLYARFMLFTDDYGQGAPFSVMTPVGVAAPAANGAYRQYSVSVSSVSMFGAAITYRAFTPSIMISGTTGAGGDKTIDLDDAVLTVS